MTRLGHSDMTAILDLVGTSRSFPDLPSFREGVLPGLGDLVPCDLVGYNEVDARSGSSMVLLDRPEVGFDGVEETLARLAHQHPWSSRASAGGSASRTSAKATAPSCCWRNTGRDPTLPACASWA